MTTCPLLMNIVTNDKKFGLEWKWPTWNCWFRLLTTLLGMCIVDMHRLYRNIYKKAYTDIDILQFSNLLCKELTVRSRRQNEKLAALTGEQADNASILEQITDKDGNHRFAVTDNQIRQGRNVGKYMHQNCFICLKYITKKEIPSTTRVLSGVATAKCPCAKRIEATPPLAGTTAA